MPLSGDRLQPGGSGFLRHRQRAPGADPAGEEASEQTAQGAAAEPPAACLRLGFAATADRAQLTEGVRRLADAQRQDQSVPEKRFPDLDEML
jgi:hypothetical protein